MYGELSIVYIVTYTLSEEEGKSRTKWEKHGENYRGEGGRGGGGTGIGIGRGRGRERERERERRERREKQHVGGEEMAGQYN